MKRQYLLTRDPNEQDLAEMNRWLAIYNFEVQRVANITAYFKANPFVRTYKAPEIGEQA